MTLSCEPVAVGNVLSNSVHSAVYIHCDVMIAGSTHAFSNPPGSLFQEPVVKSLGVSPVNIFTEK